MPEIVGDQPLVGFLLLLEVVVLEQKRQLPIPQSHSAGLGEYVHVDRFYYLNYAAFDSFMAMPIVASLTFAATIILVLLITTPIAAWLTSWEARYRGLRLPLSVVLRGLDYHAVHYLPVALVSCATVVGYRWLLNHHHLDSSYDAKYLYVLCGEVIVGAAYLFNTYWIGMRNMMYANG